MSLRDLSLAHNRLQRIEHLDSLSNLHVLSLGSNLLEDLENVSRDPSIRNSITLAFDCMWTLYQPKLPMLTLTNQSAAHINPLPTKAAYVNPLPTKAAYVKVA